MSSTAKEPNTDDDWLEEDKGIYGNEEMCCSSCGENVDWMDRSCRSCGAGKPFAFKSEFSERSDLSDADRARIKRAEAILRGEIMP